MDTNEQIQSLIDKANEIALKEVERLARKVLSSNKSKCHEFFMCMGSFFFIRKNGDIIHSCETKSLESLKGYNELDDFIMEWDEILHITGEPMRFTLLSDVKKDW